MPNWGTDYQFGSCLGLADYLLSAKAKAKATAFSTAEDIRPEIQRSREQILELMMSSCGRRNQQRSSLKCTNCQLDVISAFYELLLLLLLQSLSLPWPRPKIRDHGHV
ncbi:hypothetical protein ACLKA7_009176 [Drosophila subpalustris]